MELKYTATITMLEGSSGSNRTFMELKFGSLNLHRLERTVLIVPLWN